MGKGDYNLFSDNKEDTLDVICPKLSYEQRLWGFCICAGVGNSRHLSRLVHVLLRLHLLLPGKPQILRHYLHHGQPRVHHEHLLPVWPQGSIQKDVQGFSLDFHGNFLRLHGFHAHLRPRNRNWHPDAHLRNGSVLCLRLVHPELHPLRSENVEEVLCQLLRLSQFVHIVYIRQNPLPSPSPTPQASIGTLAV